MRIIITVHQLSERVIVFLVTLSRYIITNKMSFSSSNDNDSSRGLGSLARLAGGFRPELATAVGGAYAANSSYSSGSPILNSYGSVSLASDSRAAFIKRGPSTDFQMQIVLDLTAAAPGFPAGEELRIRVLPRSSVEAGRYRKSLPPSSPAFGLPLIKNVEIFDPATGASVSPVAGQLQARYLHGGQLALVAEDLTAGPPPTTVALTAGDIAGLFGSVAPVGDPGTRLAIVVKGEYAS